MSPRDPSEQEPSAIGRLDNPTIAHRIHDLTNLLTIMAGVWIRSPITRIHVDLPLAAARLQAEL